MSGDLYGAERQVFDLIDVVKLCNKNFGTLMDDMNVLRKMSKKTKKVAGLSLAIGLYLVYRDKKKSDEIDRIKERVSTLERQASVDDLY